MRALKDNITACRWALLICEAERLQWKRVKNRLAKLALKGQRAFQKRLRAQVPTNHNSRWINNKQIESVQVLQQAKDSLLAAEKALEDLLTD